MNKYAAHWDTPSSHSLGSAVHLITFSLIRNYNVQGKVLPEHLEHPMKFTADESLEQQTFSAHFCQYRGTVVAQWLARLCFETLSGRVFPPLIRAARSTQPKMVIRNISEM